MTSVKIAELKDQLSKHLRAVERGAEIEVTDRGRPIARIVPIRPDRPRLTIRPAMRPFAEIRDKRYPPLAPGIDSLALLREERGDR